MCLLFISNPNLMLLKAITPKDEDDFVHSIGMLYLLTLTTTDTI